LPEGLFLLPEPDKFEEVDHLVLDEAELTLPAFLSDLQNGQLKKVYRASGFCDLSDTPLMGSGKHETICVHEHISFPEDARSTANSAM
jgi:hypothetical protein